jgi:tRNA dimethylallyltransferase
VTSSELAPLLVVVGPTASGKSELALRLAEERGGEIIGADSVQVYRRFDIGSSKPTPAERARIPHHLVDCVDPLDPLDAGAWAARATAAIDDVLARGRTPIVCGGTFLWVKALVYGLATGPGRDEALRERHRAFVEARGRPALHAELARVDAASAARLAPNDFVRVSRALEVFELTGVPLSRYQAEHGFSAPRYRAELVGVRRAPAELDERIARRAREMLATGFVEEVRALLADGLGHARAMGSVGYKQVAQALGAGTPLDLVALADEIRRATRVFARRQRTWLRDQPVTWLEPGTSLPPTRSP